MTDVEYGKLLERRETPIPGLLLFELPVHGDARGWFKENWQRAAMTAAGLPDFGPVQNNISYNDARGTTRGIHAEPWDKWVSVATGRIFGAWVDLRDGPTFGAVYTAELDPSRAIFVPRGVGNAYQTLETGTAYVYLVNDHWSPSAEYAFLNLADPSAAIDWPIPLDRAIISEKDRSHPEMRNVPRIQPRKTLVVGADGQLGRELRKRLTASSHVEFATRSTLDLTAPGLASTRAWREYDTIVNAAAYTAVDDAETAEGRRRAWAVNAGAVVTLSRIAAGHGITLVHVSTDYVFDGRSDRPYTEDDLVAPLGVYGQSKAAGDAAAATAPRHYVVRTSWVIGDGRNFVRTMAALAERGSSPAVVEDQVGRPTFTSTLAEAIAHLLRTRPPYGVYNVTNSGPPTTWHEIAARVFRLSGRDENDVRATSTEDYFAGASTPVAPRPRFSMLDVAKISETGFIPSEWQTPLREYVRGLGRVTGPPQADPQA